MNVPRIVWIIVYGLAIAVVLQYTFGSWKHL